MPRYDYQARTSGGETSTGVIVAPSEVEATRQLRTEGKFVVKLEEGVDAPAAVTQVRIGGRRVKSDEVIFFASQMAVMVETGVPINEALDGIIEQSSSPAFRGVLEKVLGDVESGLPLSLSMAKHPKAFKPLIVNMVKASEASGKLGPILDRCAGYLTNQREIRRKVVGALIYPAFLMCMSIGVVIFLLTYLLPKFTTIYAGREHLLPWPTKVLITISSWVATNWMWWSSGSVLLIVGLILYLRSASGRRVKDWLALHVPLIGAMLRKTYLVRSLRTLGTLIDAGVSLLDAVGITRAVVSNGYFEDMWDRVDDRVQQGEQLSAPLRDTDLVPRSVIQMVSAGERGGKLALVLERVSDFLERDLDQSIRRVTLLIEPLMIFIMGGIVGSIVIALLLPIFTISRIMGH